MGRSRTSLVPSGGACLLVPSCLLRARCHDGAMTLTADSGLPTFQMRKQRVRDSKDTLFSERVPGMDGAVWAGAGLQSPDLWPGPGVASRLLGSRALLPPDWPQRAAPVPWFCPPAHPGKCPGVGRQSRLAPVAREVSQPWCPSPCPALQAHDISPCPLGSGQLSQAMEPALPRTV